MKNPSGGGGGGADGGGGDNSGKFVKVYKFYKKVAVVLSLIIYVYWIFFSIPSLFVSFVNIAYDNKIFNICLLVIFILCLPGFHLVCKYWCKSIVFFGFVRDKITTFRADKIFTYFKPKPNTLKFHFFIFIIGLIVSLLYSTIYIPITSYPVDYDSMNSENKDIVMQTTEFKKRFILGFYIITHIVIISYIIRLFF